MSMKITTIPSPSLPAKIEAQPQIPGANDEAIQRMKHLKGRELTEFFNRQVELQVRLITWFIKSFKGDPKYADRIHQIAKDGAADLKRTHEIYWERRRETEQASHQLSDQFAKVDAVAAKPISFAKIENPRAAKALRFPEAVPLKRCLQEHPIFEDEIYLEEKKVFSAIASAFSFAKVEDPQEMRHKVIRAILLNSKAEPIDMTILSLEKALTDCAFHSEEERFLDEK